MGETPHSNQFARQSKLVATMADYIFQNDAPVSQTPKREPKPRQRILVVEDEPLIRQLNHKVLSHSGYHVEVAEDGASAWDALQLNPYDLLLTDNNMPRVSGIDLLKKVHAARLALPVIMATGVLPAEELALCPWLQPAVTLLKPYTCGELLQAVQHVLLLSNQDDHASAPPPNARHRPPAAGLSL
jgi:CheY-like chemotaxis protein